MVEVVVVEYLATVVLGTEKDTVPEELLVEVVAAEELVMTVLMVLMVSIVSEATTVDSVESLVKTDDSVSPTVDRQWITWSVTVVTDTAGEIVTVTSRRTKTVVVETEGHCSERVSRAPSERAPCASRSAEARCLFNILTVRKQA